MAEEEVDIQEESGGKKSKLKLIIIILVVLIVLGGAGVGAFLFMSGGKSDETMEEDKPVQTKQKVSTQTEIGPLYSFDPFIVNLADPGGSRYLKVSMQAELSGEELMEELEKRKPQVRDIVLTVLSSKAYPEVSTAQGKLALKQEIMRRVNLTLSGGSLVNIYFMEFVAQ